MRSANILQRWPLRNVHVNAPARWRLRRRNVVLVRCRILDLHRFHYFILAFLLRLDGIVRLVLVIECRLLELKHLGVRHLILWRLDVECWGLGDQRRSVTRAEEVLAPDGCVSLVHNGGTLLVMLARIRTNLLGLLEEDQGVRPRMIRLHHRRQAREGFELGVEAAATAVIA